MRQMLPIDDHLAKILGSLREHKNLVLVAEPGAGKTTRVPPGLVTSTLNSGEILVLQPRRIAARSAAQRIAEENGWILGQEVGYQIRFENRTSQKTRIRIVTEGILTRRLQSDPELKGVAYVILDEFHERSLHSDMAIALLRESQQTFREDLHIIVMSATLEADPIAAFLNDCPIIRVPGRTYPVHVRNIEKSLPLPGRPDFVNAIAGEIIKVISGRSEGNTLVFLPGAGEIQRCQEYLEPIARQDDFLLLPLHGSLSAEHQDLALKPSEKSKVILATNIAETSLTIDRVNTVIDSGLSRVMRYDSNTGLENLKLGRISRASATQRAGRAGRQGPGQCVRLWTRFEDDALEAFEEPEIERVDLCEPLLLLAQWGVTDPQTFSWFESPPNASLHRSKALLVRLGALQSSGEISHLGRKLLEWPLHPRLARLMQCAVDANRFHHELAAVAASIGERNERQAARARDQLLALAKRGSPSGSSFKVTATDSHAFTEQALLLAYPDRVCRRRRSGQPESRMVGGKGVEIGRDASIAESELFVALETREMDRGSEKKTFVERASHIESSWLTDYFPERLKTISSVAIDASTGKVSAFSTRCFDDLPLEEPRPSQVSPEVAFPMLVEALCTRWPELSKSNEDIEQWLARLEFLSVFMPEMEWPVLDNVRVKEIAEFACYGEIDLRKVIAKSLVPFLEGVLSDKQKPVFNTQAPSSLRVPTGHDLKIHYSKDQGALLAVRLQEIFGWHDSPKLANGRVALTFSLLGPNYRPVQITKDLRSFWEKGYQDVRKELRSRYPKHSWPEDPWTARPEAKGRRK